MSVHGFTLSEMRDEIKLNLGNRSTDVIPNSRYDLWLNLTEIEIISAFQFFQVEKRVTTTMVVGQSLYQLPSDLLAIYALRDSTIKRKIRRSHYRKFDNIDYDVSGDPTHYIRFGNYVQLTPVPSSANTLQLRYCKNINKMVDDTDTPTLPAPWHEAIMLGAEARGWRALGELKKWAIIKNEYLALVRSRNAEWEIEEGDEEFSIELAR
jgi:hypothetical protein